MSSKYRWMGFELQYPDSWAVEEDKDSASLLLESPSGSFLTLTRPRDLEAAFERARITMEQEYDQIETERIARLLGDALLEGIVQRFIYLDFVVTSHLYKMETEESELPPLLIQIQGEDREMDRELAVFDAVLTSLLLRSDPLEP